MDKKRIHELLECMTEGVLAEVKNKGLAHVDTKEMGEAIDMIKDLAEAEKAVWEKCYYEKIVEAMKEEEEMEELWAKMSPEERERAGYDRWRTSKGRFAPKGTGHETSMAMATGRRGFTPDGGMPWPNPPYYDDPRFWPIDPWMGAAGYDRDRPRPNDGRTSGSSYEQPGSTGRMGYTPGDDRTRQIGTSSARDGRQDYDRAKRYFHESGSQESRQMMSDKACEYVDETVATMKDIFSDAEPKMQEKMRQDLFRLYREFGGKTQ